MPDYYMGVDPGPSTGIALLSFSDFEPPGWEVFQTYGTSALWLIDRIYQDYCPKAISVEQFIPSNRAGTKGKDAELTRLIANYAVDHGQRVVRTGGVHAFVVERRATDVFLWATDKRLKAAEFPWGTKYKDARSAGKHALFCAVRDGKERDPLL